MTRLTPVPDVKAECSACGQPLRPVNWHLTGIHVLAELFCDRCGVQYFKEMPTGPGLFYPGMIDGRTGRRCDPLEDNWFLHSLEPSYRQRKATPLPIKYEELRPRSGRPVAILNTIDSSYGHCVFELFNAQFYLDHRNVDLVVIVQPSLRWMVPDGVCEVWTVDLPFRRSHEWNDWLAATVRERVNGCDEVYLCRAFVQADTSDYDVERFTRISPFPLAEWDARLSKPTVTFIWRSDRAWKNMIDPVLGSRYGRRLVPRLVNKLEQRAQARWIMRFAKALGRSVPNLDFAVGGLKQPSSPNFPAWIKDFRAERHSDDTARRMCARYAESHLVIGCNGSNLVVPGMHAGGVVDLVPKTWWAVSAGSFPYRLTDPGDVAYRYALIPWEISTEGLTDIVQSLLRDRSVIAIHTAKEWRDHDSNRDPDDWGRFHHRYRTEVRRRFTVSHSRP